MVLVWCEIISRTTIITEQSQTGADRDRAEPARTFHSWLVVAAVIYPN